MLTTQQCILTHLLNCGTNDLLMLEDINYDLDEILDEFNRLVGKLQSEAKHNKDVFDHIVNNHIKD